MSNYDPFAFVNTQIPRPNGWPRFDEVYENRWLHGDYQSVAYFFNYMLYKDIVMKGELK
jgi:hypothetical protein